MSIYSTTTTGKKVKCLKKRRPKSLKREEMFWDVAVAVSTCPVLPDLGAVELMSQQVQPDPRGGAGQTLSASEASSLCLHLLI